ncbi:MAG: FAD-dependent monooxygenase [Gemmataceae bacterium]|nr:FAD-dependent monooxygenase [Gemmataceae bacterium]
MNQDPAEFTIVGNGLAGALLACALAKAGRRVDLYEKRGDPRQGGPQGGRSINLALSVRGLHALRDLGLEDVVVRSAVLMRGRMIHPVAGPLAYQAYGKDDSEALLSVSRGGLNRLLADEAAKQPGVRVMFDHRCTDVELKDGTLSFETPGGHRQVTASCIIGADGAYSAIRGAMQRLDRSDYSQSYLTHGYKELTIPPAEDGGWRMERHALHIWPRGDHMMIALPNADGSFTCTLFWPFDGPHGFSQLTSERQVIEYFTRVFPDAVPLIPDLASAYLTNPVGSLVTVRCRPWHYGGRAVLVGDAAHAVVPFLGQGMNAAFEDCSTLIECLGRQPDKARAFADYEARRKENADVLADLCIENFVEMRDKVGSPWFLMKKKAQLLLNKVFGKLYLPLYTMIEFTRIPYAEAVARARRQDRVVLTALATMAACVFIAFLQVIRR